MARILAAIGAFLAPIIREVLPLVFDEWRKPDIGERIEATEEDRRITEAINDEWDRVLESAELPPDYDLR